MPRSPVRKARPESAEQLAFTASAGARTRTQAVEATATVSLRLMAGALDAALLILVDVVVIGLTLRLAGLDVASMGVLPAPPLVAFLLLLDVGYVVVLTSTGGQTFGKMAVGIRTVDAAGHPVPMSAALMRATVIVLSLLPAGAGLVWLCVARDRRGLHDRVAGTRVVLV